MTASPPIYQSYQPPENGFRTFIALWVTQSISMIGTTLTFFCVTILLTQVLFPNPDQKTELAFALSAVSLAFGLPNVIIAPIAGAWADRYDRKTIMIIMDFIGAILSVILLVMILTDTLNTWLVVLVVLLFSIDGSFHGAAFDSSYAMLVNEKQLPRANGMMQTIYSLSSILSPAIAAGLIALPDLARQSTISGQFRASLAGLENGIPLAIALDILSFLIAATTPLFLYVPSPRHFTPDKPKTMWADIREGAIFIWQWQPILWLLGLYTIANMVIAFNQVQRPLLVKFNLAPSWSANGFTYETALAMLSSIAGIGGLIGGLLISAWGGLRSRRIFGVLIPMIIIGIAQIIYGASPWIYLTAAAAALWSAMLPILNSHSQSIWQSATPRELQGRVFSVRRVIAQSTIPIGTLLGGSAGGLFDPGASMVIAGCVMAIFAFLQLFNPAIMRIEDKGYTKNIAPGENLAPGISSETTSSSD